MQSLISGYEFEKLVSGHNDDKGIRTFTTRNLLNLMFYIQLALKNSLRDIVDPPKRKKNLWYHQGLKSFSRDYLSNVLMIRSHEIVMKTCLIYFFCSRNPRYKQTS